MKYNSKEILIFFLMFNIYWILINIEKQILIKVRDDFDKISFKMYQTNDFIFNE